MVKVKSIREAIEGLQEILEEALAQADKFEGEKQINAAGGRIRKSLQEVKKEIKPIRDMVTEIKNKRKK